ncbi:hypothetical protein [Truepera radiovictrix]|uniref:hypothetical protein n=1 Tax=Truepera radiovictrix TaxID=332249 RepID=UPI0011D0F775|nr:hypothetical protein [Truepera radiovictrix]WMT57152.1 hypothetical protein RCV51_14175 [Truepera radiovictrix]
MSLALLFMGMAHAQLRTQGALEVALGADLAEGVRAAPSWTLAGHLEAAHTLGAPLEATLTLALDPSVRVGRAAAFGAAAFDAGTFGGVAFDAGLTEAYALVRRGEVDLSAGLERLPLEVARLSAPFSVEARNARGLPRGVLGVRAAWYPQAFGASWRVRGALLYPATHGAAFSAPTPLLGVRGSFGGFELEATALYPSAHGTSSLVVGLGGSGLFGATVLYGEAWLLTQPLEARGALGASGYLGARLWTLEAAYAAPPPSTAPAPQLAGQLTLLQREADALTGTVRLLVADTPELQPALTYSALSGDEELTLSAGGSWGERVRALNVSVGVRSFF